MGLLKPAPQFQNELLVLEDQAAIILCNMDQTVRAPVKYHYTKSDEK